MLDLLVAARMVHFASVVVVGGAALFSAAVADQAITAHGAALRSAARQLDGTVIATLVLTVASGAFWLTLFYLQLKQILPADADTDVTFWSVLTETQFGRVSAIRLLLVVVLAAIYVRRYARPLDIRPALAWSAALLGIVLVTSLAWCGHASSGIGVNGDIHLFADVIYLATAAVWVGGLLPLLIFVRPRLPITALARYQIVRRFSTLAVWSVVLLAVSGLANTWFMTDGFQHLFGTEYGNLVLLKIGLFIVMLGFAGVNRFRLTPRLAKSAASGSDDRAAQLLCWSTTAEIALGFLVICVVAVLGRTEPPGHQHAAQASHDQIGLARPGQLGSLAQQECSPASLGPCA